MVKNGSGLVSEGRPCSYLISQRAFCFFAAHANRTSNGARLLLQFSISPGFVEKGHIGTAVFPGAEKVLVSNAGFRSVAMELE